MWPVFEISVLDPTKHQNKTVQSGCCGPVCNPIGQFDHKVTSFVNKNNRSSVWVNWVNEIRRPTSKLTSLKHVTFFLPIWNRNGGEHTILCKCSSITISIETVQTLASALPTPDFCQGCLGRPTKKKMGDVYFGGFANIRLKTRTIGAAMKLAKRVKYVWCW